MRFFGLVFVLVSCQASVAATDECPLSLSKPATFEMTSWNAQATTYTVPARLFNLPDIAPFYDFMASLGPNDVLVAKFKPFSKMYLLATREGVWLTELLVPKGWFGRKKSVRMIAPRLTSDPVVAQYARSNGSLTIAMFDHPELAIPLLPILPIKALASLFSKGRSHRVAVVTLPKEAFAKLNAMLGNPLEFREPMELPLEFRLEEGSQTRFVTIQKSNYGVRLDQALTGVMAALATAIALLQ